MSATETHITVDAQMPKRGDDQITPTPPPKPSPITVDADMDLHLRSYSNNSSSYSPPKKPHWRKELEERPIQLGMTLDAKMALHRRAYLSNSFSSYSSAAAAIPSTVATHFEAPEIYRAAVAGDVALFQRRLEELESPSVLTNFDKFMSSRGNTVLHLAARSGCDELLTILRQAGLADLLCRVNSSENTPLNEAVIAGNLSTVKVLVSWARENNPRSSADQTEEIAAVDFLLGHENQDRNTALHLALSEACHENESIARFLFENNSEVTHFFNKEEKSPLYMAAQNGYVDLFEVMMQKPIPSDWSSDQLREYRIRIAHAAIRAKSIRILNILLRDWSEAFTTKDYNDMMPPILLAAHLNYFEGIRTILDHFRECSYYSFHGSFPIHVAAWNGQVEIIQEFLRQCPDLRELCNHRNQNILHLAARNGKAKVVSYILKNPELEMLINEKDEHGNSPLHLAAKGGHAEVVSIMTWDSRVDFGILNAAGKTALEVAELGEGHPSYQERLAWKALRNVGAPRASKYERIISGKPSGQKKEPKKENMDFYKDRINTLMLVSTLIATITFAAGLMSPGSNSDDKDFKPNPTMLHIFVFTNTISMYSSITVIIALIWCQLADLQLLVTSLKFAVPVLGLSLAMVCVSFMAGAYLTASSTSVWLSNSILVLGSIGIVAFSLLFFPLCSPDHSLKDSFVRYIVYYPNLILIKLTKKDDTVDSIV